MAEFLKTLRRMLRSQYGVMKSFAGSIRDYILNDDSKLSKPVLLGTSIFIAMGVGFLTPYFIKLYDNPLFNFADKVGMELSERWQAATTPEIEERPRFSSIFLPLDGTAIKVPDSTTDRNGGSLTAWGDDLLALSQDGRLFFVSEEKDLTLTKIEPPFSGFDDYREVAQQAPYDTYTHFFFWFRFNDVQSFEIDGRKGILVTYTKFDKAGECFRNALSRLYLDDFVPEESFAASTDWELVFQTEPCLPMKGTARAIDGHLAGGRLVMAEDNTIYMTNGDYHFDGVYGPRSVPGSDIPVAQDPDTHYSKLTAIDFETGASRIVTLGQRNSQGIVFDRNGDLWAVEHGPRGGDELNLIVEGGNYGWPYESYGTTYSELPFPDAISTGRHTEFIKPKVAWLPSIAPSGLTLVEGFNDAWDGDLLATTLAGQMLVRIRIVDQQVIFTEFIETGRRIRDVHQHISGDLVLFSDAGELIFLTATEGGLGAKYVEERISGMRLSQTRKDRVRSIIGSCSECHSLSPYNNSNAPSLANIYDSQFGSSDFQNYSAALKSDNRVWDRELIKAFLTDPQSVVPGTSMPYVPIPDEQSLDAIVDIMIGLRKDASLD